MVKIGDSAPEFFLSTPYGVEIILAACLLEGPVLLEFIRGTWDPDSRKRLDRLARELPRFGEAKTRVITIACERAQTAARYLEEHPTPVTLLLDEDRRVARQYGVLQKFSLPVWNVARPSSFVVDRCGFVRYTYVAQLQIHSADIDEILEVLKKMERSDPG